VGEGHAWYPTVVDGGRSIVSLLSSPGQHFGLAVVARAIGIVLNNGTMWFDPMPGRVNALAPGRRVMTAGATAIVRRDGQALLAVGAPCGRRMIPAVLHAIVNRVDHGMDPQDAMKPSPPAASTAPTRSRSSPDGPPAGRSQPVQADQGRGGVVERPPTAGQGCCPVTISS
jgi:gamma-glutamyltranspeptidase/glutathione hydrolase